jgi:hypothetical protein
MVTTRDERVPVSWEQVLRAANPSPALNKLAFKELIHAVNEARESGEATDEQIQDLVKVFIASSVNLEIHSMIETFFTPSERGHTRNQRRVRDIRNVIAHGGRRRVRLV